MNRVAAWCLSCALVWPAILAAQAPADRPTAPGADRSQLDRGHDGKVTFEELRARRPNITRERFDMLDKDGDGVLTRGEDPRPARGNGERARLQLLRKVLESDANGDGKVSYSELSSAKPGFPAATFQRLDLNKDGFISSADAQRMTRGGDRPRRPAADRRRPGSG